MDSKNLATVFAPNILHCIKQNSKNFIEDNPEERSDVINVVKILIDHYKYVYSVSAELMNEIYLHIMDSYPNKLDLLLSKKDTNSRADDFRREKAKAKKSIGTGKGREEIYVSKWFAFTRMAFLLDKDKPRTTINSSEENDYSKNNYICEETVTEEFSTNEPETTNLKYTEGEEIQEQPLANKDTPKASTSGPPKKQLNKRKKPNEIEDSKISQALGILKNAASNSELKGDECGVYGQHVAHKLRSYSKKLELLYSITSAISYLKLIWGNMMLRNQKTPQHIKHSMQTLGYLEVPL
ncbi:unnamed protein product [Brassicogethes aeneus]|uniref:Rho-GAP domain-containing protein n=1 Tax=Brassicogethes aeneus TaxID=1431903 RepID=A0A9P0BDN6_BRAAE|nr:unnamed protein product [Brassicogethes aeneus]